MAAVAVNDEEILKYAVSEGIISLDDVRKSMELKERKRLLKQHHNKIFKGSDGRWKTDQKNYCQENKRRSRRCGDSILFWFRRSCVCGGKYSNGNRIIQTMAFL